MKISKVKISNFRSYRGQTTIDFHDLTVFVGKNDVGKSTILEALDFFFNEGKGAIKKIDKDDINNQELRKSNTDIEISVVFDDLPDQIVIDSTNETRLGDEYLLNRDGLLEVVKKYPNGGKEKVFIKANHPTYTECSELLLKKQKDLKAIVEQKNIVCTDKTKNAEMRRVIWEHYHDNLQLQEIEIDVTKEEAKNIWEQLKNYLPLYSLFQSDRKNSDGDNEIQDPMKLAVQEILKDTGIQNIFNEIALKVSERLKQVADRTLDKLREMNPEIANSLDPVIPSSDSLKWADVFKGVSISGDDDIPLNKRGSGVKRLILLNFFRAEAERRRKEKNVPDIIYAIEEPETSQHLEHQRRLINALIELSKERHSQIILTTHSPYIVKMLQFEHLKVIKGQDGNKVVNVEQNDLPYPSLHEVNFLAFNESDEEYHNELYGFIESEGWLSDFKLERPTKDYIRLKNNGQKQKEQKILSEYIRHQIHHPENTHNKQFTHDELQRSIGEMRAFIKSKREDQV